MPLVNRLEHIKSQLTIKKFVSVEELSQELSVSGETIRRDLKMLEGKGVLRRTYGGAYLEGSTESDVNIHVRSEILLPNKKQIAIICKGLILPEDTIFLDSSTTSLEIAKQITHLPVTVITNSLYIVNYLSNCRNMRVVALGGELDTVNMCFSGMSTQREMAGFFARKGFISCRSISARYGVMDSNELNCQVRSAALENCFKRYLIADHTKFGNTSLYKIAEFERFDAIITDEPLSGKWLAFFKEKNIEVYYPESGVNPQNPAEPELIEDQGAF